MMLPGIGRLLLGARAAGISGDVVLAALLAAVLLFAAALAYWFDQPVQHWLKRWPSARFR